MTILFEREYEILSEMGEVDEPCPGYAINALGNFYNLFHHLKLRPGNPGTVIKVNPGRVQAAWVLVPGKTDPLILLMLTADIY